MIPLTVKELFQQEFDAIYLEEKILLAEQISFCILKKIENQTTHKLKLICSKQKCQFSIKLELSPIENKYYLRDIHAEHNHHISKDKFEEKMLTGRLLKYSEFIYKTYFIHESEFCSKPKLILKDLKAKHNLDILAGNYSAAQKQKLKKKFDNIVQQLRLKKNRSLGISDCMINPSAASLTTAIGSSGLLPHLASSVGCDGLNSSMQLPSIPLQHVKKNSSNSFMTRDIAHSLSTAMNSIGDSTNKSSKKRITSSSSSNFDFQNADTMNQTSVYSPCQNNPSTPQMIAVQKGNLPPFGMLNAGFPNPHFQLTLLQQQHLLQQQQQQQQQLQQQLAMKKMSPQVISEDSRSASFCKVEDFGEPQSAASANNLDSSLPRKMLKVQNSPVNTFSNPINACNLSQNLLLQMPIQNQQATHFGNTANGLPTSLLGFPANYDFLTANTLPAQASSQTQSAEQQIMMKLQENQIQQEKIKQEELQLKRRLQQQQQQQIQQQHQIFNPFNPFMLQASLPQQNLIQNSQIMNLQLLLQNQQANLAAAAANSNGTASASKIQQNPLLQPGLLPMMAANPALAAFNNSTQTAGNLLSALPEQNLLLNQTELAANHPLRAMQASPFFPNSGMISTSSA